MLAVYSRFPKNHEKRLFVSPCLFVCSHGTTLLLLERF